MKGNLAFTKQWNSIVRVLDTEIGITEHTDSRNSPELSNIQPKIYRAVWDTGATGSVITAKVVSDLGLKPIGMTNVSTASGLALQNEYYVNIFLPNRVYLPGIRVTEGVLTADLNILIGMDVICLGDFAITNYEGRTCMSFRLPSCENIDFVKLNEMTRLPRAERRRLERERGKI